MTPQKSSNFRNSHRPPQSENVSRSHCCCDCSCSCLTWTFAVGATQLIICAVAAVVTVLTAGQVERSHDHSQIKWMGKGPTLKENQLATQMLQSLGESVHLPITSLASFLIEAFMLLAKTWDTIRSLCLYLRMMHFFVSGIFLGILLLVGDIWKIPKLLGCWLILDGLRTLTWMLPLVCTGLAELWCYIGPGSAESKHCSYTYLRSDNHPAEILLLLALFSYNIGTFTIVATQCFRLLRKNNTRTQRSV